MEIYSIIIISPSSSTPDAKPSIKWMFCRSKQSQDLIVESLNKDFERMPFDQPTAKAGHMLEVSAEAILDAELHRTLRWTRSGDSVVGISCYNRADWRMPIGFDF